MSASADAPRNGPAEAGTFPRGRPNRLVITLTYTLGCFNAPVVPEEVGDEDLWEAHRVCAAIARP